MKHYQSFHYIYIPLFYSIDCKFQLQINFHSISKLDSTLYTRKTIKLRNVHLKTYPPISTIRMSNQTRCVTFTSAIIAIYSDFLGYAHRENRNYMYIRAHYIHTKRERKKESQVRGFNQRCVNRMTTDEKKKKKAAGERQTELLEGP